MNDVVERAEEPLTSLIPSSAEPNVVACPEARTAVHSGPARPPHVVAVLLLVVFLAECAWFIGTQSLTSDEPMHLHAGIEAWRSGRFVDWNDHPPLARLLMTLPLIGSNWSMLNTNLPPRIHVIAMSPDPREVAWRVRPVNVLLGVSLGVLLWSTARRMFSEKAANLALALYVFSPAVVAHFSLATTDGIGTLFVFASAVGWLRWKRNPSRLETLLLGEVLGGLLLSKFYTLPIYALAMLLVAGCAVLGRRAGGWAVGLAKAGAILGISWVTLWAGYFFHVGQVDVGSLFGGGPLYVSLPFPEYFEGLQRVQWHNRLGHPSMFLGQISSHGHLLYYPVAMVLKWPIISLLLAALGLVLLVRGKVRGGRDFWLLMLWPAGFAALSLVSKIQIGDRHVLPIYPFLLLAAAAVWRWAEQRRVLSALLLAAVALQAADTLRYAPDYLSYFNFWVSPEQSYTLLSDSNLDWGQGLLALRQYQQEHKAQQMQLLYFGSVDPSLYGITSVPLGASGAVTGTVVVSATYFSGLFMADPKGLQWLLPYRKTMLNHSLFVFDVPRP